MLSSQTQKGDYVRMKVLTNLIVAIISLYIYVSNHYIVYLKHIYMCQYVNKARKKGELISKIHYTKRIK